MLFTENKTILNRCITAAWPDYIMLRTVVRHLAAIYLSDRGIADWAVHGGRDSRSKRTFLSWYLSLPPSATTWLKIKHLFLTEPRWGTNLSFKMRMVLNVSTWFKLNWTLTFWRNKRFSLWRCSWEFLGVWNPVHCYSPTIQVTGMLIFSPKGL